MCLCAPPVTPLPDDQSYSLKQNASTGATIPTPSPEIGCPRSAIKDPLGAALCPLTNGIHPNFNSKKCVEVQRYADGAKVDVYVVYLTHSMSF